MSGLGVYLRHVSLDLDGHHVLDRIDLDLPAGAKVLLLGANGAGKTQLLKMLIGERWPTPTAGADRRYRDARGRALELPDVLPRLALVGGERQDKYYRYDWNFSVQRIVATGVHGTDRPIVTLSSAERTRVRAALVRLGLWVLRRRRFLTLSYGERRRVLLARALVGRPRLLLLDEAYNGLDVISRRLLDRELTRLGRTGLTVVLAVHRLEDAPSVFTRAIVMARGRIRYDGLRAKAPGGWLETGDAAPMPAKNALPLRRRASHDALAVLSNVSLYRDYRPVIRGLDWRIDAGEHWAILGRNGSGKSTLLGCLYGMVPVALGGELKRRGHPPGSHIEAWRRRVGFISPELQSEYLAEVSVLDFVVSGLHASVGLESQATRRERRLAARALSAVGLTVDRDRSVRTLSYGQRRLALFARALVLDPEALLLDEPLTGLDAVFRRDIKALLARLADSGVQLVLAVHHLSDLIPAVDHVLEIRSGRGVVRALEGGRFSDGGAAAL